MARATQQQQSSFAGLIVAVGVIGAGAAFWYGYPGMVAIWLGVVTAAWAEPRPMYSGPKDSSTGAPTPLGRREQRAQSRYVFLSDLRWRLVLPGGDWMPGWPVQSSFLLAVIFGLLVTAAPVNDPSWAWANAAAVFILVAQLTGSRRRTATPVDPSPGVHVGAIGHVGHLRPLLYGSLLAGGLSGLVSYSVMTRHAGDLPLPGVVPLYTYAICLGALVMMAVLAGPWKKAALTEWEERVTTRQEWEPRWEVALGNQVKGGLPTLVATRVVGDMQIDTFDAPAGQGALGIIGLKAKLAPAMGGGTTLAMLAVPNVDSSGAPMPGTEHPIRFDVVTYPSDAPLDVSDPDVDLEAAAYAIRAALSDAVDKFGQGGAQFILIDIEPLHVVPAPDGSATGWGRLLPRKNDKADKNGKQEDAEAPVDGADEAAQEKPAVPVSTGAVWMLQLGGMNSMAYLRSTYAPLLAGNLGVEVLVNDWPEGDPQHPGANRLFVGSITDPGTVYADESALGMLTNVAREDEWNNRWSQVLKQGANYPEPHFGTYREAKLGRGKLESLSFTIKQGESVEDFSKLEPKLATTLLAAPFVSLVAFRPSGGREGDRHAQAFTLRWSEDNLPSSADALAPSEGIELRSSTAQDAEHWLLAGQFNAAFDHARLERPEVIEARPLTARNSRAGHIWKVELRLHGGVDLTAVRSKMARVVSSLGVPWCHVTPSDKPQTIVFVLGADYRKVRLSNPGRQLPYLADLEWQQAWADAKLVSSQGHMPTTLATEALATNEKVLQLDFELPSGITPSRVRGAVEKLKGSTRNEFVQLRPGAHGANSVRLLVCEEDPMPFPAAVNFDYIDSDASADVIPFATGIEGEPVSWNIEEDPHLLVVGSSGSGKSALLQMLLYSMGVRGWEVHVADPIKAGADFRFASPWLKSMSTTVEETSAMMDAVYAEVERRRSLNGKHGVGSYQELPDDVRPNHVVIVIDEFTSLILGDKPRKPSTPDPEAMAEYAEALQAAALVDNIGAKVGRFVREARSAGVTLVLSTQRLTAKELDSIPGGNTIRTNMSRILLGKATYGEMQSALRDPDSAPDIGDVVPRGRGLLETSGSPIQIIQSWYDNPIQGVLTEQLTARVSPLGESDRLDLVPFMPKLEETVIEGAVISSPAAAAADAEVVELGVLDLGDFELPGEDLSGMDLGVGTGDDAAEEDGADDVTSGSIRPARGLSDRVVIVPAEHTLVPDGATGVWVGHGPPPDGLVALPEVVDGIFGDRVADGLAELLEQALSVTEVVLPRDGDGTDLDLLANIVTGAGLEVSYQQESTPDEADSAAGAADTAASTAPDAAAGDDFDFDIPDLESKKTSTEPAPGPASNNLADFDFALDEVPTSRRRAAVTELVFDED